MPPVVMAGVDLAPRVDDGDDGLTGEVLFAKAGLLHAGAVAEASHVVGAKPTVTTEFLGTFGHLRYDIEVVGWGGRWLFPVLGNRGSNPRRGAIRSECALLRE